MQWFYIQNGERIGPVEEDVLFQLAREGKLTPDDMVWNPSMGEQWQSADTVPGLFPVPTAPAGVPTHITPNRKLMARALDTLRGQWPLAVGVTLLYHVIIFGANMLPYGIAVLILSGPMLLGVSRFFLNIARLVPAEVGQLFDGFKLFWKTLGAYLLMNLIIGLWSLLIVFPAIFAGITIPLVDNTPGLAILLAPLLVALFILSLVPAIRAALGYSQVFFILADEPDLKALDSLRYSRQIMKGFKWKLFCLGFRFIGWAFLCLFTCGIGFLWLYPYMTAAYAHFYDDIRLRTPAPGEPRL